MIPIIQNLFPQHVHRNPNAFNNVARNSVSLCRRTLCQWFTLDPILRPQLYDPFFLLSSDYDLKLFPEYNLHEGLLHQSAAYDIFYEVFSFFIIYHRISELIHIVIKIISWYGTAIKLFFLKSPGYFPFLSPLTI